MTTAAVIVAAGRGLRAGGGLPKQWRMLAGRTIAAHALDAFRRAPGVSRVVLVLSPDDMGLAPGYEAHADVSVATGGATRSESVRAGLEALAGDAPERVLIHDVARPLVSQDLISRVVEALDTHTGAAPALAVTDALWSAADGSVSGTVDRTGLFRAQTPQGFHYAAILDAHRRHPGGAADDVEVARWAGIDVHIVEGEERNLKITTPDDFARAELFLGRTMNIRTGNGFDVHAFGPGDRVILCGIPIPHAHALSGHSDADVGMHALTDAIYGALADGDIGRHFPPSEATWKGADSALFLEHAMTRAAARGFEVSNADVTLICEAPKIGPHADDMRQRLADIMSIDVDRVSVKATTSERLGFTGRQEGIAALASVTLTAR